LNQFQPKTKKNEAMKTKKLIAALSLILGIILLTATQAHSGVQNVRVSTVYYYPAIGVYYYAPTAEYIYISHGVWTIGNRLPAYYSGWDLRRLERVRIDYHGKDPWKHHKKHVMAYGKPHKGPAMGHPGKGKPKSAGHWKHKRR
jgi:hypothetical protein